MDTDMISMKIAKIEKDLEILKDGRIHELEKGPGNPKCSTLANRIKDNLNAVVEGYESLIEKQAACADQEQFDLLAGMLAGLATEIANLSKKQPDGLINSFKINQINRVLRPLKEIMQEEPSVAFLDILSEPDPEGRSDKSRNTYSDTALVLSLFREACGEYRGKHYGINWDIRI